MNSLEKIGALVISLMLFVVGSNAQTKFSVALQGWVEKSADGVTYTVGEFKIQAKAFSDSIADKRQFDVFVGKEVDILGYKLAEKVIEVTKIKSINQDPTEKDYPVVEQSGKNSGAFLPKGWAVIREAKGDLNKDGRQDKVQVIKNNDVKFYDIYPPDGYAPEGAEYFVNPYTGAAFKGYDNNPKILIVLINNGAGYSLLLQNNSFVSEWGYAGGLDEIAIKQGRLTFKFEWSDYHGAYGYSSYSFRFDGSRLVLATCEIATMRVGEYGEERKYDFLKKKVKRIPVDGGEKGVVQEKRLIIKRPFDLRTFTESQISEVYEKLFGDN